MSHITEALKQSLSYFKALKLADGAAGVIDGQVQHLVNLCEKALAEPVKQEPEKNDWYIDAFLQVEVRLKKHFGVE